MTACVAHHDICSGEIRFYFVPIVKLNGADAIIVDDAELQTIDEINGDEWNSEVVRVLRGETRADSWTQREMENILRKRFAFLQ
jgi:hypothetical protein